MNKFTISKASVMAPVCTLSTGLDAGEPARASTVAELKPKPKEVNARLGRWREAQFVVAVFVCLSLATYAEGGETMKPGEWIPVSKAVENQGVTAYGNGALLGNCDDGDWVAFGPLDLADGLVDRVEIELAAPNTSGKISLHLDQPTGVQISEVTVLATGGYDNYAVRQGHCEQLAGEHRVYLVFHGGQGVGNVKAFRFLKPDQKGSPGVDVVAKPPSNDSEPRETIEQLLAANRDDIEKHRTTLLAIRTTPGATVTIKQARHHFQFGTAINRNGFVANDVMSTTDQETYKRTVLANFNSVVHENAMKWYSNEKQQDQQTFGDADAMLEWSEKNGLYTRGHCVYWGRDAYVQKWIKDLDDDALRKKLQERAKIYMTRYKGRVPEHDVNNEMLHCTYFKKRLGGDIWKQMFGWCREYDPGATLYVNDYSILSGGETAAYVKQIDGFLKSGMPVGGIGVQGHFGGGVNGNEVKRKLDQLAQFGLPIKVTEFDANTKDEHAKAVALATLYTTAFAHPAVEGIYMWGFWKKCHWRPNAGLWNADWSETPAAKAYRDLVFNRWWTDETVAADAQGMCTVRVFFGQHDVAVNGKTRRFEVAPPAADASIDCREPKPENWTLKTVERPAI